METDLQEASKPKGSLQELPFDLLFQILALVPRRDYGNLKLTCHHLKDALCSPQLYEIRASAGSVEPWLYYLVPRGSQGSDSRELSLSLYDPGRQCWKKSEDAFPLLQNLQEVTVVGSSVYFTGGLSGRKEACQQDLKIIPAEARVDVFDARTSIWRQGPEMNVARARHSAAVLNKKLVVVGGVKAVLEHFMWPLKRCDLLASVEVLEEQGWRQLASLQHARYNACLATVREPKSGAERLYALGGWGVSGKKLLPVDSVEVYIPELDRWEVAEGLPYDLDGFTTAVVKDRLFVIGGASACIGRKAVNNHIYEYIQGSGKWEEVARMPGVGYRADSIVWRRGGRVHHSTTAVESKVYISGGLAVFQPRRAHLVFDAEGDGDLGVGRPFSYAAEDSSGGVIRGAKSFVIAL